MSTSGLIEFDNEKQWAAFINESEKMAEVMIDKGPLVMSVTDASKECIVNQKFYERKTQSGATEFVKEFTFSFPSLWIKHNKRAKRGKR